MDSDLLPRPFFSQGLSSGFRGCLLELQRATARRPKRHKAWRMDGRREDSSRCGREGKQRQRSCCVSNPNFSLTLIVTLEMDSPGGKFLIPRGNEMTFFRKEKLNCIFKGKTFSSLIMVILKASCQALMRSDYKCVSVFGPQFQNTQRQLN